MVDSYAEGDRTAACSADEHETASPSHIEVVPSFGEKAIGCSATDICHSDMMTDRMCVVRTGNLKICLYPQQMPVSFSYEMPASSYRIYLLSLPRPLICLPNLQILMYWVSILGLVSPIQWIVRIGPGKVLLSRLQRCRTGDAGSKRRIKIKERGASS